MIVVKLIGGLGNQMFQYAIARSLADRYNVVLKLDLSGYEQYALRHYELGGFNIRAEIADRPDMDFFKVNTQQRSVLQRIKTYLPFSRRGSVFREAAFVFDERVLSIKPPVYLDGYWQTERYFIHNSEALRRDFTLRQRLDERNGEMLAQIKETNAVSLHIRRGDYLSDSRTNDFHGVCSLEYYHAAIHIIAKRVENPHIFIFTDDHEWAKNNLDFKYPSTLVDVNSGDQGILDMMLMCHCKHHIIANSSFSWWGAWLNPSPEKIVIAPKSWFRNAPHDTSDLLPKAWITL
jgi:hypothetical protein